MGTPELARLVSIQVGLPTVHRSPTASPWRTGYVKRPVAGPVWVGPTHLAGDGQANRRIHGGPEMAVLAYAADHYPLWRIELEHPALPDGAFAENFTITGQDETRVCIGDVYAIGAARLQVSRPRGPCANISRRWNLPALTDRVRATGRTGWYLRVLTEGEVVAGAPVELVSRPADAVSVARASRARRG